MKYLEIKSLLVFYIVIFSVNVNAESFWMVISEKDDTKTELKHFSTERFYDTINETPAVRAIIRISDLSGKSKNLEIFTVYVDCAAKTLGIRQYESYTEDGKLENFRENPFVEYAHADTKSENMIGSICKYQQLIDLTKTSD